MKNFTFILFLLMGNFAFAQCYLGLNAGTSHYFGDLAKDNSALSSGSTKGVIGIEYGKIVNRKWDVRFGFNVAQLAADDLSADRFEQSSRGYDFKSSIIEFQMLLDYKLLKFKMANSSEIVLGLASGLSMLYFDPKHENEQLAQLVKSEEDYVNYALSIPLNVHLGLGHEGVYYYAQIEMRKSFTDYLDGLSSLVNANANDSYGFFKIGARIPMINILGRECL